MANNDNKYLIFELKDERYGIPITKVKEIIGILDITHVPKLSNFIKGVINLRGKIIPVIDLRLKFEIEEKEYNERTCIIIVRITTKTEAHTVGIVVDTVQEVLDIGMNDIQKPPKYSSSIDQEFITGMGKVNDFVIMLLDIDRIFTKGEVETLETI